MCQHSSYIPCENRRLNFNLFFFISRPGLSSLLLGAFCTACSLRWVWTWRSWPLSVGKLIRQPARRQRNGLSPQCGRTCLKSQERELEGVLNHLQPSHRQTYFLTPLSTLGKGQTKKWLHDLIHIYETNFGQLVNFQWALSNKGIL